MVGLGFRPTDALRSAMTVAARVLGPEGEIGRIRSGFAADAIAVEGDPLANIRVMEDVRFVMRAGRVAKSPQTASGRTVGDRRPPVGIAAGRARIAQGSAPRRFGRLWALWLESPPQTVPRAGCVGIGQHGVPSLDTAPIVGSPPCLAVAEESTPLVWLHCVCSLPPVDTVRTRRAYESYFSIRKPPAFISLRLHTSLRPPTKVRGPISVRLRLHVQLTKI